MEVEERDRSAKPVNGLVENSSSIISGVKITCSWLETKNSVSAAFTFLDVNRKEKEGGGSEDCVDPDSCVLLSQREGSQEPLWIQLETTDAALSLTKLHILSEASFVEVYGLFGEYIKTVTGELVEEVDSTMVFSCPIDEISLTQLRLKFLGLKGAKEVWLFGGCVWTERNEAQSTGGRGRINMTAVNSRLGQGNCQLSPSADSLKRLVADYLERNNQAGATSIPLEMLPSVKPLGTTLQPSHSVDFVKTYIDSSLKNMENRLMDNLSEQMRELELRQNKRLDHILKLLETNCSSATTAQPNPDN